ncbi:MAG: acetyl-CoA carboxylase biotin carboxyl carrier protein [Acidobacteria bacterium]|nr:acetyl-CoA carboxylase biotin carboxyl carrier protein [Acidobacteriota bacterium]
MNFKEIKELVDLVARKGVGSLEIERAGFRIRIEGAAYGPYDARARRGADPVAAERVEVLPAGLVTLAPAAAPAAAAATVIPSASSAATAGETGHTVTSPIVGTFYRASNPDSDPFVKVGDEVTKGQTLCIVEAMKLMNEIEADVSGTVLAVYPQNGQPVEFGEKLFLLQPR